MQEKKNSIAREFEELIELKSFNVIEKEFSAKKAGDKDLKTPLLPKSDHNATSQVKILSTFHYYFIFLRIFGLIY